MVDRWGSELTVPDNWRGYAVFVVKGYAVLLSVLWLLVAGLLLAGYLVGPAPATDHESPTVDLGDPPNDVAADALAQLRTRDHTFERRLRIENLTDGTVWGGIMYRIRVNHSTDRVRMRTYPSAPREGYTTADAPHYEFYGTKTALWQRYGSDGPWHRADGDGFSYYGGATSVAGGPEAVRRSEAVVRRENETAMVVEITDGPALDAVGDPGSTDEALLFVIEKEPSPRLHHVRYSARRDDTTIRKTVTVTGLDATPVEHPSGVPRARATSALDRAVQGAERIIGWVL